MQEAERHRRVLRLEPDPQRRQEGQWQLVQAERWEEVECRSTYHQEFMLKKSRRL